MQVRFPKHYEEWKNQVEHLLQGLRIDFDRLWKNLPQVPDPEAGIPFTGPLVPGPFTWPPVSPGSDSATPGTLGSPLLGSYQQPISSGTRPATCADCGQDFYFTMYGLISEPTDIYTEHLNLLNGTWQLSTAAPEDCEWASDRIERSGSNPAFAYWTLEIGPGLFGDPPTAWILRGFVETPTDGAQVVVMYDARWVTCPVVDVDLSLKFTRQSTGLSGTGNPYDVPHPLKLYSGVIPP